MAVQQIDAQCAMARGLVDSEAVVRRLVVRAAVAFFHLEQEDVDRGGARIARLAHRVREAHHLGEDAASRHQLRGHVLDLVGHAVAVGVAGVGQGMLPVQRVEDAELVAHMTAIQTGKGGTACRAASFRRNFLSRGRRGCDSHPADEQKHLFPCTAPRRSTPIRGATERRRHGISRVFHGASLEVLRAGP
jgi:hypothetical protein